MDIEAFKALKPGDKVILVAKQGLGNPEYPEDGTVLHRVANWMDDDISRCFQFDNDGGSDYAFFIFDEVEPIEQA